MFVRSCIKLGLMLMKFDVGERIIWWRLGKINGKIIFWRSVERVCFFNFSSFNYFLMMCFRILRKRFSFSFDFFFYVFDIGFFYIGWFGCVNLCLIFLVRFRILWIMGLIMVYRLLGVWVVMYWGSLLMLESVDLVGFKCDWIMKEWRGGKDWVLLFDMVSL